MKDELLKLDFIGICTKDFVQTKASIGAGTGWTPAMTHPDMPEWLQWLKKEDFGIDLEQFALREDLQNPAHIQLEIPGLKSGNGFSTPEGVRLLPQMEEGKKVGLQMACRHLSDMETFYAQFSLDSKISLQLFPAENDFPKPILGSRRPMRSTPIWLGISTPDIREALGHFAKIKTKILREATPQAWGGTDAILLDPDGNPLQLVQYNTHPPQF